MATHPVLPLWIDDYEAATVHLSAAQDGIYGRLLRLSWRTPGCSLPADEAWIARKVRVTPGQWERDGKPVLEEFFKLQRGRYVQKRLKAEYEDISRKKTARVAAGKKGGEAKAQKSKGKPASNASVLPPDTRAFPSPSRTLEETPQKPPEGAFAFLDEHFNRAWDLFPVSGRGTSNRSKAREAWDAALPDAGGSAPLLYAIGAFAKHHASEGERAKAPPAFHRWLADRRFEAFLPTREPEHDAWSGPAEIRSAIVAAKGEAFARSWLDGCDWQDAPVKAVTAGPYTARRLRQEVGDVLSNLGVQILEQAA